MALVGSQRHRKKNVFSLLRLYILIFMYDLFYIFCFHRANWHSSANLTEDFPWFFLRFNPLALELNT